MNLYQLSSFCSLASEIEQDTTEEISVSFKMVRGIDTETVLHIPVTPFIPLINTIIKS